MRLEHLHIHQHLSRRDALGIGAAAGVAAGLASLVPSGVAGARHDGPDDDAGDGAAVDARGRRYDDRMFDPQAVIRGAWVPSAYGPGDQRGTFNELTSSHTARALGLLKRGRPVNTYQIGEELYNGFPAFPSDPPRLHEMFLYAQGYQPAAGFVEGGGILGTTSPIGINLLSGNEERFRANHTYQIGTQLDGLGHVGVGDTFYNGIKGAELASATGLTALGNETMGPVVTRAVIFDVVGLKLAQGKTEDLSEAPNGNAILRDDYRITIEDLRGCLYRQRVDNVGPGDIPIIHTGWTHLADIDPKLRDSDRYLAEEPGIYLAEARWFADRRPALIASDSWGLEVTNEAVTGPGASRNLFPCHQELFGKYGIRIGEGFVTDEAIADDVYEGVLVITPQNTPGATAGSSPPVLLGQPGRRPRY